MKKSIEDEKPHYELCVKSHEPLVEKAERDVEEVKSDVVLTKERWEKLNAEVDERLDKFNGLNDKLKEINEKLEPIEEYVTCCEQTVENLEPIGIDKDKGHKQIAEIDVCNTFSNNIHIECFYFLSFAMLYIFHSFFVLFVFRIFLKV